MGSKTHRRECPPELAAAEAAIEAWRASLLRKLHPDAGFAAYLLVTSASAKIAALSANLNLNDPIAAEVHEQAVRQELFGLQFALLGLQALPSRSPIELSDLLGTKIKRRLVKNAVRVLDWMKQYSQVRDVFLTYFNEGYGLVEAESTKLVFVDPPDWSGSRDRAQSVLSARTKLAHLRAGHSALVRDIAVDLPCDFGLGGLAVGEFKSFWGSLRELSVGSPGAAPIFLFSDLRHRLASADQIDESKVQTFFNLIRFDGQTKPPLTLFHCPLVCLTDSLGQVVSLAMWSSNVSINLLRLAIHRGVGLGRVSSTIVDGLLTKLENQFAGRTVAVRKNRQYKTALDKGDVDLVVYNTGSDCLLLAQVKGFICPDSVPEVLEANEMLRQAIEQTCRTRTWFDSAGLSERRRVLDLPDLKQDCDVRYTVLGNGFIGSDFIAYPDWIQAADVRYLLRPAYKGASIFDVLNSFKYDLQEIQHRLEPATQTVIMEHPVEIHAPAWTAEM